MQKAKKVARVRRQKEAEKAEQLGQEPVRKVPRTIENTREKDETMVQPDDEEVIADEQQDEFAGARCSWPLGQQHTQHGRDTWVLILLAAAVRYSPAVALQAAGAQRMLKSGHSEAVHCMSSQVKRV